MIEVDRSLCLGMMSVLAAMSLSWTFTEGGVCFTKSGPPSVCYSDNSYFASSAGLICCLHADAVGFTASDQPAYEFSLRTFAHYTTCQPCSSLLVKGFVVCFTKSTTNGCSNMLRMRMRSPKDCCHDNIGGGFAEELLVNQGHGFTAQYKCTPCTVMPPTRAQGWSEWSSSSACSVTCGQGQQVRHRSCLIPPQHGGCVGGDTDVVRCLEEPCNDSSTKQLEPGWSDWSMVSLCNSSCGPGFLRRKRHCLRNIGIQRLSVTDFCPGKDSEEVPCQLKACFTYKQLANRPAVIVVCVATGLLLVASVSVTIYWRKRKFRYLQPEQTHILHCPHTRSRRSSRRSSRSRVSVQPVNFPEMEFVLAEVNKENMAADVFHYDNPTHVQDEESEGAVGQI